MKNTIQVGAIALILGAIGFSVLHDLDKTSPVRVQAFTATGPEVKNEVDELIRTISLNDKETLYKIFKGIADYCENTKRIRKTHVVSDIIAEVFVSYKMENHTELDSLITSKMKAQGLEKDTDFSVAWPKMKDIFNEIAEGVKYSIERSQKEVK